MQRGVAAQVDRLARAVAEYDVRVRSLDALNLPDQPVVKAQLVDDRRLQPTGELRVEHLVGMGAEL
jgi:hypothetical protein